MKLLTFFGLLAVIHSANAAILPIYDLAKPPASAADAPNVRAFGNNKMGRATLAMDFNGDGFSDLVTANHTEIFVWFGKNDFAGEKSYHTYYGILPDVTISGMTDTGSMECADLNGDGKQDLIVGKPSGHGPSNSRSKCGEARVIFGKAVFPGTLNLNVIGVGGADVTIYGASANDRLTGNSNSWVRGLIRSGDLNGDGITDLILGAYQAEGPAGDRDYSGEIYVVYGRTTFPTTLDLAVVGNLGANVTIYAPMESSIGDNDGCLIADLNGDGVSDLILGTPHGPRATDSAAAGRAYVVFGRKSPSSFPTTLDLAIQGAGGADVTIYGAEYNNMLTNEGAMAAGDVNGDGISDLVLGANSKGPEVTEYYGSIPYTTRNRTGCGAAYIVYGRTSFPTTVDLLHEKDASSNTVIYGMENGDHLTGMGSVAVGDLDGDGLAEIVLGAPFAKGPANSRSVSGEIYIVKGRASFPAMFDLAVTTNPGVTTICTPNGQTQVPRLGMMKMADLDGDGFNDLVINASGVTPPGIPSRLIGAVAYIVNGRSTLPTTLDLTNTGVGGASTTILGGVAGTILTRYGITFGDFNNDGGRDLLISSLQATHYDVHAATNIPGENGETYVIYGGAPVTSQPEISLLNSDASDVPSGSSFAFGTANVGTSNFGIRMTVRNVGTAILNLGALTWGGANPADFNAGLVETEVGPGLETELVIGFDPKALGARSAVLHIPSNDLDENPFILHLNGIGNTPYDDWTAVQFGSSATDINISGFDRDPDGNGMSNGVEYVFGTNRGAHPTPAIVTDLTGTWLELQLVRSFIRKDVILEVEAADHLAGPWELAARADGDVIFAGEPGFDVNQHGSQYQAVIVRDRVSTTTPGVSNRFMRLKITRK